MNGKGYNILFLFIMVFFAACSGEKDSASKTTKVLDGGCYPHCITYNGHYYYTMQWLTADTIAVWETSQLDKLAEAKPHIVWTAKSNFGNHFWSPELKRLRGHWYLYFEADDGNTDNHQMYVLECQTDDPMTGEFVLKDVLQTNDEWNYGLHPDVIEVQGELYLFWSGWPKRRAETETQCIYIAKMENPWTVSSERVMISKPEYEWERQWINPNGNRSAYPIFVNENPQAFLSPSGDRLFVAYSASGIWTVYSTMGLLQAPTAANLLDTSVWRKESEPQFGADSLGVVSSSNISIFPSADGGQTLMLYEVKQRENGQEVKSIHLKPIEWSPENRPIFGTMDL